MVFSADNLNENVDVDSGAASRGGSVAAGARGHDASNGCDDVFANRICSVGN